MLINVVMLHEIDNPGSVEYLIQLGFREISKGEGFLLKNVANV